MTRLEHVALHPVERLASHREDRPADALPEWEIRTACENARRFLLNSRLDERRSADGKLVGIQARLSQRPDGAEGLDLREMLDGLVSRPEHAAQVFARDPLRDVWQKVAEEIQKRLGFPLEPELFSNMLVVASLGRFKDPELATMNRALLSTFANTDVRGLYHFFTSLRFACDVDCTGMAARARLTMGDIDPTTAWGARTLRQITQRILGSAAVCNVSALDNESQGKEHGALCRHVLKVYLDDHEVQGAALDRGLKNNPVVAINGILPILAEVSWGLRNVGEVISLKEFPSPDGAARFGHATVAEILASNLGYIVGHFFSGAYRGGCRYYGSPDAFLCFFTDLLVHFPAMDDLFGLRDALYTAIDERREAAPSNDIDDSMNPLNLALRAIAASNMGMSPNHELAMLIAQQDPDGGFSKYCPLYALGSKHGASLYFGSTEQTTALALRALYPSDPGRMDVGGDAFVYSLADEIWSAASSDVP